MRTREEIEGENKRTGYGQYDGTYREKIIIELLLDIRELLQEQKDK